MNVRDRLAKLERVLLDQPAFTIEIEGEEPPENEWAAINEAHDKGSMVLVFAMLFNTLGIWAPGESKIIWSGSL